MALSSIGVTLKWGASAAALTKKVDIKDFPDLIGEPNALETTDLSKGSQTFIPGVKASDTKAFTVNYTSADFATCKADEETDLYYALEFSDGSTFTWQGQHTLGVPGKGVDEVLEFTINILPSSEVAFTAAE